MTQDREDKLAKIREVMIYYGIEPGVHGFEHLAYCVLFRSEDRLAPFSEIFQRAADATGRSRGMIPHLVRSAVGRSPRFPKRVEETVGVSYSSYLLYPSLAIAYLERFLNLPYPRPVRASRADAGDNTVKVSNN